MNMEKSITKFFEGQEIKVTTDKGNTLINLACTARVCGLIRNDKGTERIRWVDIKNKLGLIYKNCNDESSSDKIKQEIEYILDEIENTDDRNSVYMSSWLSKRLSMECHSPKAMEYKNFLATLDEAFQNGELFKGEDALDLMNQQVNLMNKQVSGVIKEVKKISSKVNTLENSVKNIKENSPLYNVECDELQDVVKKIGVRSLGGYGSPAYKDNSLRGKVYRDIQNQLRREFGVKKYKAIKRCQLNKAKEIVSTYAIPTVLKDRVTLANNQIKINVIKGNC